MSFEFCEEASESFVLMVAAMTLMTVTTTTTTMMMMMLRRSQMHMILGWDGGWWIVLVVVVGVDGEMSGCQLESAPEIDMSLCNPHTNTNTNTNTHTHTQALVTLQRLLHISHNHHRQMMSLAKTRLPIRYALLSILCSTLPKLTCGVLLKNKHSTVMAIHQTVVVATATTAAMEVIAVREMDLSLRGMVL